MGGREGGGEREGKEKVGREGRAGGEGRKGRREGGKGRRDEALGGSLCSCRRVAACLVNALPRAL